MARLPFRQRHFVTGERLPVQVVNARRAAAVTAAAVIVLARRHRFRVVQRRAGWRIIGHIVDVSVRWQDGRENVAGIPPAARWHRLDGCHA